MPKGTEKPIPGFKTDRGSGGVRDIKAILPSPTLPMELQQYDRFEATFEPERRDDLRDEVEGWIGERLLWEAAWVIEEGDSTKFVGEWACVPIEVLEDPARPMPSFAWTPSCDLFDVRLVKRLVVSP